MKYTFPIGMTLLGALCAWAAWFLFATAYRYPQAPGAPLAAMFGVLFVILTLLFGAMAIHDLSLIADGAK